MAPSPTPDRGNKNSSRLKMCTVPSLFRCYKRFRLSDGDMHRFTCSCGWRLRGIVFSFWPSVLLQSLDAHPSPNRLTLQTKGVGIHSYSLLTCSSSRLRFSCIRSRQGKASGSSWARASPCTGEVPGQPVCVSITTPKGELLCPPSCVCAGRGIDTAHPVSTPKNARDTH